MLFRSAVFLFALVLDDGLSAAVREIGGFGVFAAGAKQRDNGDNPYTILSGHIFKIWAQRYNF